MRRGQEESISSTDLDFEGEELTPTDNDVTDEVDAVAATIVLPEFEARATAARASADDIQMAEVQEEYHEARRTRAQKIIDKRREEDE